MEARDVSQAEYLGLSELSEPHNVRQWQRGMGPLAHSSFLPSLHLNTSENRLMALWLRLGTKSFVQHTRRLVGQT